MERNQFHRFADAMQRLGASGTSSPDLRIGTEGSHSLQYIPFEHVNAAARLVIVGITPGTTQLSMAYATAQELLIAGTPVAEILATVKKVGAFGGPSMRPNLLKLLRHFHFERILDIDDVATLFEADAHLLHSTSVVPHAAFKSGKMFAGSFQEVMSSPLLKECFLDCFVPSAVEMGPQARFVGLGTCPQAALAWCVKEGVLDRQQVLGAFCHPSTSGGSTTRYYLREISREDLKPNDPVRARCDWLDEAYAQMRASTASLLGGDSTVRLSRSVAVDPVERSKKPSPSGHRSEERGSLTSDAIADASRPEGHTATILAAVRSAGYREMGETVKLTEFEAPNGHTVYLDKTLSEMNRIRLMVHPELRREVLAGLEGVEAVRSEHRFHSNMKRFPRRLNGGQTPTAYGWQITIATLGDVPRVLTALSALIP